MWSIPFREKSFILANGWIVSWYLTITTLELSCRTSRNKIFKFEEWTQEKMPIPSLLFYFHKEVCYNVEWWPYKLGKMCYNMYIIVHIAHECLCSRKNMYMIHRTAHQRIRVIRFVQYIIWIIQIKFKAFCEQSIQNSNACERYSFRYC